MQLADQPVRYFRFSLASGWSLVDARVISETSVSLTINGEVWLSFTCTPTDLDALAVGFLFNEGVIEGMPDIAAVDICKQGTNVDVWLHRSVERPKQWRRTSGCTGGVTSIAEAPATSAVSPWFPNEGFIQPEALLACMDQLLEAQELYRGARGVHCSALSDGKEIRVLAEDIGRHNTLDKLAGRILLDKIHIDPALVVTTGRVSSEMLQKSARLGASAVVSRTSPTSLSVSLAEQLGITLIGYARRNQFLVYTHPERLSATLPERGPVPQPAEIPPGC